MADAGSYSAEEPLTARVWVNKRLCTGQTKPQVMTAFCGQFNKVLPQKVTMLYWKKFAITLGSVKDTAKQVKENAADHTCSCFCLR
jgi:hypothetical protein